MHTDLVCKHQELCDRINKASEEKKQRKMGKVELVKSLFNFDSIEVCIWASQVVYNLHRDHQEMVSYFIYI